MKTLNFLVLRKGAVTDGYWLTSRTSGGEIFEHITDSVENWVEYLNRSDYDVALFCELDGTCKAVMKEVKND